MSSFGYDLLGFGSSANTAVDLPSDDQFNYTSFLSHFDGANNGVNNAFDDGSTSNHTCTADGLATQGSFGPFARPDGEWGVDFAGNSGTRKGLKLCDGYQTELVMTGTFTIEFWLFHRYYNGYQSFFGSGGGYSGWAANIGHEIIAFCGPDSKMYCQFWNGSALINTEARAITLNEGEWNHVAVVNNGGDWTYYLNGTGNTTTTFGNVGAITSTGTWASYIGGNHGSGDSTPCRGVMSNVRFVKGTAVYTSNFTPPTAPLTAITNTSSLVAQNNRFIDNSSHANTLSTAGVCQVSAFGPFLTDAAYNAGVNGASTYFSGAEGTSIIITDDLTDFQFGTGAFTVEGWVYRIGGGSGVYTIHQSPVASGSYVSYGSSGKFVWGSYGNGDNADNTTSTVLANNQWIHFAAVRTNTNSNGLKIYINGVVDGTFTDTSDYDDTPYNPRIGGFDQGGSRTGNDINAYICDIRVVKGTAVYTGNFTPPTAPLTAITNTKLLLNMADGQAIDSAAQNPMTLIGGAKVSSTQSKFGGTSMVFDESGDYATLPTDSFKTLGKGNFTIECFARFATSPVGNGQGLFGLSSGYLNSASRGPAVGANNSNGRWAIYHGTTNLVHGSLVPATNTWYHVAYVRNSGVTKLYIDGTQILSATDTTDYTDKHFVFGGWYSTSYLLNGYIDDFRISQMARYTNNFTPPTAPFPDKGQDQ